MIPGDRLFCVFAQSFHLGDTFTGWPLHATIVPWFRSDVTIDELGRELGRKLGNLEPFRVIVGGEAQFGRGRKTVNLIEVPSPLETLEQTTRGFLHGHHAWIVDETTQNPRQFRPHITVQKIGRVHAGDSIMVDSVYIIEQKGHHKEIVSRIHL